MSNIDESYKEKPEQNQKQTFDQEAARGDLIFEEYEKVRTELNEYKSKFIKASAEMDNQRKRMEREIDSAEKFALHDFILKLLPAKDSMEKGIEIAKEEEIVDSKTLLDGMRATLKLCNEAFRDAGLEEINPLGEVFDPELHEAMSVKKVEDIEANQVLTVFQKGCILNGRLVRPAWVEVSINS
jgi:molecular chaperone GrpE